MMNVELIDSATGAIIGTVERLCDVAPMCRSIVQMTAGVVDVHVNGTLDHSYAFCWTTKKIIKTRPARAL